MKSIPRFVLNYTVYAFLFFAVLVIGGKYALDYTGAAYSDYDNAAQTIKSERTPLIMIDPGHGGEDGGAVEDGVLEKDLNLAISARLSGLYELFGIPYESTRTEDKMLYDKYADSSDYRGHKKTYDLRARLQTAEESGAAIYVGIHMNRFPKPQYKGLQVYYSPNTEESGKAAAVMQSYAKRYLDPSNERETKKATQAIYILKRIKIPAILIECGFLSNAEERAKLCTPEYQRELSAAIFASTVEYLCAEKAAG